MNLARILAVFLPFTILWTSLASGYSASTNNSRKEVDYGHTLFIFSDPPLSQIYINGKRHQAPTPASIRIPANVSSKIELRHPGYQNFEYTITPEGSGSEFQATLVKK